MNEEIEINKKLIEENEQLMYDNVKLMTKNIELMEEIDKLKQKFKRIFIKSWNQKMRCPKGPNGKKQEREI